MGTCCVANWQQLLSVGSSVGVLTKTATDLAMLVRNQLCCYLFVQTCENQEQRYEQVSLPHHGCS